MSSECDMRDISEFSRDMATHDNDDDDIGDSLY